MSANSITRTNTASIQRIAGCIALAFALLAAQTLGFMHSVNVLHLPHRSLAVQAIQASSSFERLFAGHDDSSTCRLFDQASHGVGAPSVFALILPALLPMLVAVWVVNSAPACPAAYFQARGPPVSR